MIFTNGNGIEIDRIIGYRSADEFLVEIERINSNRGTIGNLTERLRDDLGNDSLIIKLAEKWAERGSDQDSYKYWNLLLTQSNNQNELALVRVAQHNAKLEKSPDPILVFIHDFPDSPYLTDAYGSLKNYYRVKKDTLYEANTHRDMITLLMKRENVSASDLNGYAWRMTELEKNLDDALEKVKTAVQMASDKDDQSRAQILDTEAEVLWKLDRPKKAIKIIEKCIQLQPEDDYYKKQKEKFQSALNLAP